MSGGPDPGSSPAGGAIGRRLVLVALATLGVGMAGAILGVIATPLFVPATGLIALGLLAAAAAGILGVFGGRAPRS